MPCPTCDDTRCVGPNLEDCPSCKDDYRTVAEVMKKRENAVGGGCCVRFADHMGCDCLSMARAWEKRLKGIKLTKGTGVYPMCKGSWGLGNNCGKCDRCNKTCYEAVEIIKNLQKQIRRLMKKDRIAELEAELKKLREE